MFAVLNGPTIFSDELAFYLLVARVVVAVLAGIVRVNKLWLHFRNLGAAIAIAAYLDYRVVNHPCTSSRVWGFIGRLRQSVSRSLRPCNCGKSSAHRSSRLQTLPAPSFACRICTTRM